MGISKIKYKTMSLKYFSVFKYINGDPLAQNQIKSSPAFRKAFQFYLSCAFELLKLLTSSITPTLQILPSYLQIPTLEIIFESLSL
jgi:hypothetical protein